MGVANEEGKKLSILQKNCSGTKLGIGVTPDLPFFVEVGLRPTRPRVGRTRSRVTHIKKFPIVLQYFFESAVANWKSRSASSKFTRRLV